MFIIFVVNKCSKHMSPRTKRYRKLLTSPAVKGFTPFGPTVESNKEQIVMLFEEYESIKLCDYDNLSHQEAAEIMEVSRPTFSRIYSAARKKVATSFAEGRQIAIEGGKVYFDSDWYHCHDCGCYFTNTKIDEYPSECGLCGSGRFIRFDIEEECKECRSNEIEEAHI